jgi:hypothetical protein
MIVHVEQIKVKVSRENENEHDNFTTHTNKKDLEFDLQTTIGIYVSRTCSNLIQERRKQTKDDKLAIIKLSNITSSRRMISAIHNLSEWPQHRSLLKPMIDDPYFELPTNYDPSNIIPINDFNIAQSKTIAIAECMYDDIFDRMHIVHGPPGKLFLLMELRNSAYFYLFRYRQKSNDRRYCIEIIIQITRIRAETQNSSLCTIK